MPLQTYKEIVLFAISLLILLCKFTHLLFKVFRLDYKTSLHTEKELLNLKFSPLFTLCGAYQFYSPKTEITLLKLIFGNLSTI